MWIYPVTNVWAWFSIFLSRSRYGRIRPEKYYAFRRDFIPVHKALRGYVILLCDVKAETAEAKSEGGSYVARDFLGKTSE